MTPTMAARSKKPATWMGSMYFEKRPNESKYADYDSALVHYEQAIELFEEIESYNGLVTSLTNASEVYRKKGAMNRAEKLLKRANSIVKETQDLHNELIVLSSLAAFYREKNDYKKLKKYMDEDGSFLHFELKSEIDTSELQSSLIQFTEALFGLALWYVEVTA